ncbi:SulP family inorganic anion transporter, partial [Chloroflexus sp.]|uniref:SulP family inorganic anion transporter n=1 Tax=Chloroflexus sp. TaxID=1904827 RepID=UPI002ACE38D0
MLDYFRSASTLFTQPIRLVRSFTPETLRADFLAGLTVGLVLLPQSLAFAILGGLPPIVGLYSALTATIAGALWGSSSHLNSGPTNTAAIITLSVLAPVVAVGSADFVTAASLIAVMAGIIRLLMGVARLGILVNFVSDAVSVGFTAGAGILILSNQISTILRIDLPSGADLFTTINEISGHLDAIHWPSLAVGMAVIALIVLTPRLTRKIPAVLISIVVVSPVVWFLDLKAQGVRVMGPVPPGFPPLAQLPIFDLALIAHLLNGALALAIIGLVEAVAIARAIAGYTGQRIDSNQEFVGQGLANIVSGMFSGMPCSSSFNRSALAFQSGGKTAFTAVVSGITVFLATTVLGPLLAEVPRAALAGALAVTAWSMVDRRNMARIWRGSRSEGFIMMITLVLTLTLPLQFAILIGVLMSLGYYLLRTAMPRVEAVT